ncbi:MAG: metallophosphoesterase [Clostridia bacterium]|nr:metallophosphoesterase [Clostridia bacterium]
MSKRILAALFSIVLVIGMIPFGALAEKVSEHTYTVPTVGASASSEKPLITVGTIADGHVDYGIQNNDPYIRSSYIKAMNALKAEGVDIVLDGGDMVSDNEDKQQVDFRWTTEVYDRVVSQYKKYSSAASSTGITLWACGNHDYEVGRLKEGVFSEGDYNSYEGFQKAMVEAAGQPVGLYTEKDDTTGSVNAIIEDNWLGAHFNVKGFDFIIINPPYARSDYYTTGTLAWLDETLAKIGANKTVFITGHYPLQDSKGPTSTSVVRDTNYTNFMNVMKKYDNAIYLFGHIHDSDTGYISADTFERITHYDKDGKVVGFRSVNPTSFISSFMGSAGYYSFSYNPGGLTAAEPKIVQAMTIKVYTDRIEFKMINCGEKEGTVREPLTYTVKRGDNVPAVEFKNSWTLPTDIISQPNATSGNFGLYYMNQTDGVLSNDWNGACGATYLNIKGGYGRGTFASASSGGICVFPEAGKSAVVQFTAPSDGLYLYEVPVTSIAMTANGTGNKQVVFSVMKDGVIYDITQPTYNKNYSGSLTGTIKLKKGDKLLFTADWYVKFFDDAIGADHNGKCWAAGSFNTIAIAQLDTTSTPSATKKYSFDGSGLNFTESGYSIKSNDHYTLTAIDLKNKKLLNLERGEMTIYTGPTGAPIYKGSNGQNIGAACYYTNGNLMFGPFGSGNADRSTATAIAFTAPEKGTYNMTALLLHDWDYNATSQSSFSMVYEILDSDLNVIFSGNTKNVYTGTNVQHTYSRAAGTVYLDKGEKVYLAFRSAPEATVTASDAVCMRVVSLATTQISANCEHEWNNSVCGVCGKTCTHSWKNSVCSVCSKVCSHSWKNGKCSVCSLACTHSYGNDDVCDTCGYKKPAVTTTNPTTTTPDTTTNPDDTTHDSTPGDTTVPDSTPGDTTDPDSGSTTKPNDTTVPDVTEPNDDGKGDEGGNQTVVWIIVIAAVVVVAGVVTALIIKKKKA